MISKILVVSDDKKDAVAIVEIIASKDVSVYFSDSVVKATTLVRENVYDVIILGDKLGTRGDTFDVGLEIKASNKNKHTPVICIGKNTPRAMKLHNLLRPRSLMSNSGHPDFAKQIKTWLCDNFAEKVE